MKIAFFGTQKYERNAFESANQKYGFNITWMEPRLTAQTAHLAVGHRAVCSFVEDRIDKEALGVLKKAGVEFILLRCAGFNHVDVKAAEALGLVIVRVPAYSPHAIAEHAMGLLLSLNRKIHRAYQRVREFNFSIEGLVGFDLYKKKVGVIGTGKIGETFAQILLGFGCQVLAYDLSPSAKLEKQGVRYVELPQLFAESDVISLHVPLTPETQHLVNKDAFSRMKEGVVLINTSRGGLIDSSALIQALKSGKVGGAALDVYEEEEGVFFHDLSEHVVTDDVLARLITFPNVLITSHQAFLTREALSEIATTTLENASELKRGEICKNQVRWS